MTKPINPTRMPEIRQCFIRSRFRGWWPPNSNPGDVGQFSVDSLFLCIFWLHNKNYALFNQAGENANFSILTLCDLEHPK